MPTKLDPRELALLCAELADSRKAENLVVLDMRGLSTITDFFVLATGTSEPHVRAIWNETVMSQETPLRAFEFSDMSKIQILT